jgi:hypothetical protein
MLSLGAFPNVRDGTTFLFIERSSEREPAFPIEIYFAGPDEGGGFLVNMQEVDRWADWPCEFLAVHDIREEDVRENGTAPSVICARLEHVLASRPIYTQTPEQDRSLLEELFAAAELPCPDVRLSDVRALFLETLEAKGYDTDGAAILLTSLANDVSAKGTGRGGAAELPFLWGLWHTVHTMCDAPN